MIKVSYTFILSLFINLLVLTQIAQTDVEGITRSYPFPLAEVEAVITDWLKELGFEIHKTSFKDRSVGLDGVRENESCRIFLQHYSPLASNVEALFLIDARAYPERIEELWNQIAEYASSSSGPDIEKGSQNQGIPVPVLSQTGSVVCIRSKREAEEIQVSGFIINESGLIICTAHGLKDCGDIIAVLGDGQELDGIVVKMDLHRDLTLIRMDTKVSTFISLNVGRDELHKGEILYSVGCPIGYGGTVFSGVFDGPPRRVDDQIFWQVKMKIHPGSSGSPVFDIQGNLVAMIKGRFRGTDSVGFLIPLNTIIEFVEEI